MEFKPTSGMPTVGLKETNGEFLKLTSGKWYYEVTIGEGKLEAPRFGWCDERFHSTTPDTLGNFDGVGDNKFSWGIDGVQARKRHDVMNEKSRHLASTWRPSTWRPRARAHGGDEDVDGEEYGEEWKEGDIVGCMADLDAKSLSFSLNDTPMGLAFQGILVEGGLFPALTMSAEATCSVTCNFGEDPERPLKHQPDGYSPVVSPTGVVHAQPIWKLEQMHDNVKISPWLLSMQHVFEKFEGRTWWYGVYMMSVRLLETSMLVFFRKRSTKASVATAVAVVSLVIAEKFEPWLSDSDDEVRGCECRGTIACPL